MVQSKRQISQKRLRELGDDLVAAIENAAWQDEQGHANLFRPTHHMESAMFLWKAMTRSKIHAKK